MVFLSFFFQKLCLSKLLCSLTGPEAHAKMGAEAKMSAVPSAKVLAEIVNPSGQRLQLVQGDLTHERVDAIVNPANRSLQHGGGVAALIFRKGGSQIQTESDAWVREHGPVDHAEPAYTGAGALPYRYVIHAVGPVWGEGGEDAKLAAAVAGSLRTVERLGLASLSLPAISTGIFGFPKDRAARVILSAIHEYYGENPDSGVRLVRLCLFDEETVEAFLNAWESGEAGGPVL
jgi:O-acetyl-ADP-ribose deacetylase